MLIFLILVWLMIIFLEIPYLINKKWYREIIIFMVYFVLGAYMSLAQFYNWAIYNPLGPLIDLMAPLVFGGS